MTPWLPPVVAGVCGLATGGAVAYRLVPRPAPEVRVEYRDRVEVQLRDREVVREVVGPERVTVRTVTRVEAGTSTPATICTVTRIEQRAGTVVERVHTEQAQAATERASLSVTLPAPLPRWSVSAGAQLGLDLVPRPVIGGGLRLAGPVWLEVSLLPLTPAAQVGLRVTF